MLTRILTGIVAIPIVLALVFWPGGMPFAVLVALASIVGLIEFYGAARTSGIRPQMVLGLIAAALILFACGTPGGVILFYMIPVLSTGLLIVSLTTELFRSPRAPLANVGTTVLGVIYVPLLMSHFALLRSNELLIKIAGRPCELGAGLVFFALLTTWALDTGAYFVGKAFGKRKLAPEISPGKTVEGGIGGFASAMIVGTLVGAAIGMPQPHGLILGGIIGVVGQIGDLAGSAIKREVGLKDFGNLIPGHGGVLDRIDSLLFVGPIVYYYYVLLLTAAWIR